MEQDITREQALQVLAENGGYGAVRVYGIIADGECVGQAVAIKSRQNLDRYSYSRIYSNSAGIMDYITRK